MKRHAIAAAIAGGALMFTGMTFAAGEYGGDKARTDQSSGAMSSDTQTQGQAQAPDMSNVYLSNNLIGTEVKNSQDEALGSISDLVVDKDGKVSHVVLEEEGTLGMGGDKYLVPWDRVSISGQGDESTAMVDVSSDQISSEFSAFEESQIEQQQPQQEPQSSEPMSSPGADSPSGMDRSSPGTTQ